MYDYASLRKAKALTISAALGAGGADGPVEILCLPHRQAGDWGWVGDATQRHLLFISASRYSRRLHVVLEDLRDEIFLSSEDEEEGVRLGMKPWHGHHYHTQPPGAEARWWLDKGKKQLPLARMIYFGEQEWEYQGVPDKFRRAVANGGIAPAFHSELYWRHLDVETMRYVSAWSVQGFVEAVGVLCSGFRAGAAAAPAACASRAVSLETALAQP